MTRLLILLLAFCFPFLIGYFASLYYPGGYALGQATNAAGGNPWNIALLALLMIVGIFSSFVFEKARQSRRDGVSASLKIAEIFTDIQFVGALFVSPLIFNSIYALTNQNPEALGDFLLAYQNGFFWQTVLAGVSGSMGRKASAKAKSTSER